MTMNYAKVCVHTILSLTASRDEMRPTGSTLQSKTLLVRVGERTKIVELYLFACGRTIVPHRL
jgi:hypothetical protein